MPGAVGVGIGPIDVVNRIVLLARRRYPLVYQYEDIVFPSMALAMVCDYLDVPIDRVEVWPVWSSMVPSAMWRKFAN